MIDLRLVVQRVCFCKKLYPTIAVVIVAQSLIIIIRAKVAPSAI